MKSCRGADMDSDHFMVKIQLKFMKMHRKRMGRFQRQNMYEYGDYLRERYEAIDEICREFGRQENPDVDKEWTIMESASYSEDNTIEKT